MNIESVPFPRSPGLETRRAKLRKTAELFEILELVQHHSQTVFGCDLDTVGAQQIDDVADLVNALVVFMQETSCNAD